MLETILNQAAQAYGISPKALTPLVGGHFSHVYTFHRNGQDYVLRITPPNEEIGYDEMQAILTWVHHLATHNAPVAGPIPSQQGQLIERISENGQTYVIAAFHKASGIRGEELPFAQWDDLLYTRLGQALGKLHALAQTYTSTAALQRPTWHDIGNCYNVTTRPDGIASLIWEKRQAVVEHINTLPQDAENYGLLHGDFHGGNYFVDTSQHTITVFDFDDCVYGWYAMDIAMSVFDALVLYPGTDRGPFIIDFLTHYLKGYLAEKSLERVWLAQLPHFLKLLETTIYMQVAPEAEPEDMGWIGRFMQDRERRIREDIPYVAVDFGALFDKIQAQME